jgi:hypothetical protein
MSYTSSLEVNPESAFNIVRNIYECFRIIGDALLISQEIEPSDHVEALKAIMKLDLDTRRPINTLDNLRRIRHNINYNMYHPTLAETLDTIDIAKACFEPLVKAVKHNIPA